MLERNESYIKCGLIFSPREYYIVTDGNGVYGMGKTIKLAQAELTYYLCNYDKSYFENLNLDSVLSYNEAMGCYKTIVGDNILYTYSFCVDVLDSDKENYTIREIIELSKDVVGGKTFEEFFK